MYNISATNISSQNLTLKYSVMFYDKLYICIYEKRHLSVIIGYSQISLLANKVCDCVASPTIYSSH